ncbi:MAG: response regulator [Spirochaetaceae bacterium]|nr:MAG: response regulator [Spirochaetaceae bacterium]
MINTSRCSAITVAGFLLFLCVISSHGREAVAPTNPHILVLDSYHIGFDWSDSEVRGFLASITEACPDVDIPVEHLDAKRFYSDADQLRMKDFLTAKYRNMTVDMVVAFDNPALELLIRFQDELFPGVPVVFGGIADYDRLHDARKHMTGIAEIQDLENTIEIALRLHPGTREVFILEDDTSSGRSGRRDMEAVFPLFGDSVKFTFMPPLSFSEAKAYISSLPSHALVILHSFATDRLGQMLPVPENTRELTAGARVPIYGTHEPRLGFGIIGGYMLAGDEHGRRTAAIARDILSGKNPDDIPVDTASTSQPMFDYNELAKFRILRQSLPQGSRVINEPDNLFTRYAAVVLVTIGVLAILLTLLGFLVVSNLRRRRIEATLRVSEANYRSVIDNIQDVFYRADAQNRLLLGSPSGARLLGFASLEEMMGMQLDQFWDNPEERRNLLEKLKASESVVDYEVVFRRRDGTRFYASVTTHANFDEQGRYIGNEGIIRDITARKKAEAERELLQHQFLHSQKMEAVGRLAGGIAHDFNNTLSAIMSFAELAKTRVPSDHPVSQDISEILAAGTRTTSLVKQLLAFSRRQSTEPRVIDIKRMIGESARLLSRLLGEDVDFVIQAEPDVKCVKIDPSQLDQILANLAVNARDAMPDGGTFRIHTSNVIFDESFCKKHRGSVEGEYVLLEISDTGVGMDQNVLSHAFEPFFTTKDQQVGTGLGLATVYGIVKQWNGFINVTSSPGSGTVFSVYLPCHDSPNDTEPAAAELNDRPGTETILMVEDEAQILTASSIFLKRKGYTVICAPGPGEALKQCAEYTGDIDLLVTDIVMPGMDGKELAEKISKERPGIRVLFMSGYTADVILNRGVIAGSAGFIQKPFMIKNFLSKIREVLDAPRPG